MSNLTGFEHDISSQPVGNIPTVENVDEAVLAALPEGCTVTAVSPHGSNKWALSCRIDTVLPDLTEMSYFLKFQQGQLGKEMTKGEYEGDKAINEVMPKNCPKPLAYGTYVSDPDWHFFLMEFREIEDEMPPAKKLVAAVAEMHKKSRSPNGKFGFHCNTHAGNHALNNDWCDSWEEFFTRQFKEECEWERGIQGQNDELNALLEQMFDKVIPRLLRPLQTGGRSIKPSLCHGNMWHGNIGIDRATDEPIIFDPAATYGHNEYDMTSWRAPRYKTSPNHQKAYRKHMQPSEPAADADDRNALYALRNNITVSAQWPLNKSTRVDAMDEMRRLIAKYPGGYEEFERLEADSGAS